MNNLCIKLLSKNVIKYPKTLVILFLLDCGRSLMLLGGVDNIISFLIRGSNSIEMKLLMLYPFN